MNTAEVINGSPWVNAIKVISPSPPSPSACLELAKEMPYIEDYNFLIYVSPPICHGTSTTPESMLSETWSPGLLSTDSACSDAYYSALTHLSELSDENSDDPDVDLVQDSASKNLAPSFQQREGSLLFSPLTTGSHSSTRLAMDFQQPPELLSLLLLSKRILTDGGLGKTHTVVSNSGNLDSTGSPVHNMEQQDRAGAPDPSTNSDCYPPGFQEAQYQRSILSLLLQQQNAIELSSRDQITGNTFNFVEEESHLPIHDHHRSYPIGPAMPALISPSIPPKHLIAAHDFLSIPHRIRSNSDPLTLSTYSPQPGAISDSEASGADPNIQTNNLGGTQSSPTSPFTQQSQASSTGSPSILGSPAQPMNGHQIASSIIKPTVVKKGGFQSSGRRFAMKPTHSHSSLLRKF
ncbi:hypothetical protein NP233_g8498 [Leucocoprinus birnbaumii]|uniref:Uncharacterized protein n=1 Tax=Leucocoprinus birnbaumii TaxID=56174 RepID=A0AAD5VMC0_9AGAR|nr:hypothetical protein NP233_g8498 [Leucocoprinus birnbaumii]